MRQPPDHRVPGRALASAATTPSDGLDNPAPENRPIGLQPLPEHFEPEIIVTFHPRETSTPTRPPTRRPDYTLNSEEPDNRRRESYDREGWRLVIVTGTDFYTYPAQILVRVWTALRERGHPDTPSDLPDDWREFFDPRVRRKAAS